MTQTDFVPSVGRGCPRPSGGAPPTTHRGEQEPRTLGWPRDGGVTSGLPEEGKQEKGRCASASVAAEGDSRRVCVTPTPHARVKGEESHSRRGSGRARCLRAGGLGRALRAMERSLRGAAPRPLPPPDKNLTYLLFSPFFCFLFLVLPPNIFGGTKVLLGGRDRGRTSTDFQGWFRLPPTPKSLPRLVP